MGEDHPSCLSDPCRLAGPHQRIVGDLLEARNQREADGSINSPSPRWPLAKASEA